MGFTGIAYSFQGTHFESKASREGDGERGGELNSITEGKTYLTPKHMCAYKSIPYKMLCF